MQQHQKGMTMITYMQRPCTTLQLWQIGRQSLGPLYLEVLLLELPFPLLPVVFNRRKLVVASKKTHTHYIFRCITELQVCNRYSCMKNYANPFEKPRSLIVFHSGDTILHGFGLPCGWKIVRAWTWIEWCSEILNPLWYNA